MIAVWKALLGAVVVGCFVAQAQREDRPMQDMEYYLRIGTLRGQPEFNRDLLALHPVGTPASLLRDRLTQAGFKCFLAKEYDRDADCVYAYLGEDGGVRAGLRIWIRVDETDNITFLLARFNHAGSFL